MKNEYFSVIWDVQPILNLRSVLTSPTYSIPGANLPTCPERGTPTPRGHIFTYNVMYRLSTFLKNLKELRFLRSHINNIEVRKLL